MANRALPIFPANFNRYLEPFLGGAAIFFHLNPERGILSDSNWALIETYMTIKEAPCEIEERLEVLQARHSDDFYYSQRSKGYKDPVKNAAKFIYLNRTCFNGMYRENLKGEFNVPRGTKNAVVLKTDCFSKIAQMLSAINVECCDFEITIDKADAFDFIYVDPPFTVKHNHNGFVKYNQRIFSWTDQERLFRSLERAALRGAMILISNADHESIRELYASSTVNWDIQSMSRASLVGSKPEYRGTYDEILISNYSNI